MPSGITKRILKSEHAEKGHTGGDKLIDMILQQFELANEREARQYADRIKRTCEVCQGTHITV